MSTNVHAQTSAIPKILVQSQLGVTAATTVGTVPASSTWTIKTAQVCNTTASAATVTLDLVPSGQTSGVTRRVVSGCYVAAGDTLSLTDILAGVQLGAGDFVAAWAGTATALTLTMTGIEAT